MSAPSAIDATIIQDATQAIQSDFAEQQSSDTLHNVEGDTSTQLPEPPDFDSDVEDERIKLRLEAISQVLSDTIEHDTERRLEKLAARWSMSVDDLIKLAAERPNVVAPELAPDPVKQRIHERLSFNHCVALKKHEASPVLDTSLLPTKGPFSVHLVRNKGLVLESELGRSKRICKSMDIATLVSNPLSGPWLVVQYHKHTSDEGGAQDYAGNDMRDFARAARVAGTDLAEMPPSLVGNLAAGTKLPVVYVAVVDGSFWTNDRVSDLRKTGRESSDIHPGGFYVRSTADLAEFFESISQAA